MMLTQRRRSTARNAYRQIRLGRASALLPWPPGGTCGVARTASIGLVAKTLRRGSATPISRITSSPMQAISRCEGSRVRRGGGRPMAWVYSKPKP